MDEKEILQKMNRLEKEIADLRKSKLKNRFSNFFKKSFTKFHWVVGVVIVVVASSLIVYATQITFTDGTIISATEVNSNFTELYNKTSNISARVSNSSDIGVNRGEWTPLTFDTELFDNGDLHSTTTTTSRLTAPTDGIYLLSASAQFALQNMERQVQIRINGTTSISYKSWQSDVNYLLQLSTIYKLSATDYVEVLVWHQHALSVVVTPEEFSMVRLASD